MQSRRTKIKDALAMQTSDPGADTLRVKGWLRSLRDSKKVVFMSLNDGSCFGSLQAVLGDEVEGLATLRKLGTGACVELEGKLVESPAKGQSVELKVERGVILGEAPSDYPLQKKRHGFEFLREIAHLRMRTNTFGAVFRVRSVLSQAVHEFFAQRGFFNVHTPIITGSDCEGAGEMFRVSTLDDTAPPRTDAGGIDYGQDFFGKQTFLTVSGQLNGEAFALGLGDIYTFGPTFRAENSNTSRHAAEFWMIEPEMAFADLEDDCDLAEDFVKHCLRAVLDRCGEDLNFFNQRIDKGLIDRLQKVVDADFARIDYTDAVKRLEGSSKKFEYPVHWGANLQAEHERWLTEEDLGRPTFVVNYPKAIKAFYMRRNDDQKTVAAMDLLVPKIGELIGGSQREERLDVLRGAIDELPHATVEDYAWYLDTRRFGSAPHAGFGLGFERLVMYATGMENIRDVIPFPRTPRNAAF